ncbi:carbohydrate ABC transporter permease [Paenibacillus sp. KQZ6P-2]|uniref:Carbohydrate ABC transporter permease n=1 Tax=Paenibacillus mangrovi TaxID=2931978 RepID=A0A9X1WSE0_9BACL|nr:carbohydrate ABC transporter permease [Paenibacillus mangrovi]MCJ8012635.1 carbohydrate ABC transporter permease [Paenibacillus mangrovi]
MLKANLATRVKQKWTTKRRLSKIRYMVLGREINQGLIFKLALYSVLIITSYIYMNPIIKMLVKMVMSIKDLIDPTVMWIPSSIYLGHVAEAWKLLDYPKSLAVSLFIAVTAAVLHCIACGLAGYALARLDVPFKKTAFFLVISAFIIPPQVIILPTIMAYTELGLNGHLLTLILPSVFGFGVKGALFVIIFRQFFLTQPKALEEAARIDGANALKFYARVMFPLAKPAILVVFLFSFVWTWNDTYYPRMFLGASDNMPLALKISYIDRNLTAFIQEGGFPEFLAEPIKMGASFLVILPPLLIYLFAQRYFVESVERTGLVE